MENKIKAMELMKESSNVESDYGKGVYNGIELCLALLQDRSANFSDVGDYKIEC
jgi:hypothetical protein